MDKKETKKIRFIDSRYNTLFYVPDGGKVVLTYSDGTRAVRTCSFIDEYHTRVGGSVYHICEFAEKMERNGTSYMPEAPQELPDRCYATMPDTGALFMILKGNREYYPSYQSAPRREQNEMTAARENQRLGVTPQQAAAMLGGYLHGWDSPMAQTAGYSLKGEPLYQA